MDLIEQIQAGFHDSMLAKIQDAARARQAVVRGATTITDFGIGDRIKVNELCGTRYLIGATGQIIGKRRTKVVIKLDKPMGRFIRHTVDGPVSAEITVPTTLLDRI